jgi:hypothetical protein
MSMSMVGNARLFVYVALPARASGHAAEMPGSFSLPIYSCRYKYPLNQKPSIKHHSAVCERLPLMVQWAWPTRLSVRRMPDQGHRFESEKNPKKIKPERVKLGRAFLPPRKRGFLFCGSNGLG